MRVQQSTSKKIAQYIKYQRKKRKLSITQLAKRAEVSPSYISKLEQGQYQSTTFDVLQNLAHALEMKTADFLRKCGLISEEKSLPSLEYFLKEEYQFSPKAIVEIVNFINFAEYKYKKEIQKEEKLHQHYWQKQKKVKDKKIS
jgi:transcriptional regulator with XRE-family HTH domain